MKSKVPGINSKNCKNSGNITIINKNDKYILNLNL